MSRSVVLYDGADEASGVAEPERLALLFQFCLVCHVYDRSQRASTVASMRTRSNGDVVEDEDDEDNETVSIAPQFTRYTVNCISRDSTSHLLTHLVVYIIALCSSLNTTTFFLSSALSSHIPQRRSRLLACLNRRGLCSGVVAAGSVRAAQWRRAIYGAAHRQHNGASKQGHRQLKAGVCCSSSGIPAPPSPPCWGGRREDGQWPPPRHSSFSRVAIASQSVCADLRQEIMIIMSGGRWKCVKLRSALSVDHDGGSSRHFESALLCVTPEVSSLSQRTRGITCSAPLTSHTRGSALRFCMASRTLASSTSFRRASHRC
jgi:hypothetical protein